MSRKTILTCAVTGNITSRQQHPAIPITPAEIAQACITAAAAGASVVHIHARDPETGLGTTNLECFREIVDRIKQSGSDVIINLSTGEGGRFIPSLDDPRKAAPGTTLLPSQDRIRHVEVLQPEICTLDFNTMFSGRSVVINTPTSLKSMAEAIYAAGVLPEIEIFDSGDLQLANEFVKQGIIRSPALFQIVLGVRYGAMADPDTLFFLSRRLPPNSVWAAFGIGRAAFPMLAQAWVLGGHVRIGLEDTVYMSKGVLAKDNAELVERAVNLVENLGGSIATPAEARAILGLS